MSIAPQIHHFAPELSPRQLDVVGHVDGPLRVVAGPGAGKTRTLTWRPINLLAQDVCGPQELLLLAFGQPAAAEMRYRFLAAAQAVGYRGDADSVRISTIHSLCHRILCQHHRRVGLGSRYTVLNQETQLRFLDEHYDTIFGPDERGLATCSTGATPHRLYAMRPDFSTVSPRRIFPPGDSSIPATLFTACSVTATCGTRGRCEHATAWTSAISSSGPTMFWLTSASPTISALAFVI